MTLGDVHRDKDVAGSVPEAARDRTQRAAPVAEIPVAEIPVADMRMPRPPAIHHRLSTARGILLGVALGAIAWTIIGLLLARIF